MTNKDKHKLFGVAMTIAFHAIVIVLLLVLCFRTPLPLPGEAGVEVNLGMYAEAINQQGNKTVSQQEHKTASKQVEEVKEVEEDILSEDKETPSINEEPKDIEKVEETEEVKTTEEVKETEDVEKNEEVVEEKPVVNQRAMLKVPKDKQNISSEGNSTEGICEQGSPNGLKDIERYEGNGGSGGGPAYDLGGRGAKSLASPGRDNVSEEGKVVVDIWVDKDGRVQRTEIGKGTTITNSEMRALALQAAKNSIFNKDENAADLQKGTITYTFIIRQ